MRSPGFLHEEPGIYQFESARRGVWDEHPARSPPFRPGRATLKTSKGLRMVGLGVLVIGAFLVPVA